jgi:hypothetical protein
LFVIYLSLCTQCSLVHDVLVHHQPVQAHHPSERHCSPSAAVPQTAGPLTADQERTTVPVCCDLMGANKATIDSPVQTTPAPLLALTFSPPDSRLLAEQVQSLHIVQALHSSRPPPLYLLHATLLI